MRSDHGSDQGRGSCMQTEVVAIGVPPVVRMVGMVAIAAPVPVPAVAVAK